MFYYREDALTFLPNLWILREAESGSIVGCVFAKVEAKEDGSPYVYIGLLAVKVGNQVSIIKMFLSRRRITIKLNLQASMVQ
jgi:hypothetical protein